MKCRFCHNPHLVFDPESQPPITDSDIFDFLDTRKGKLEGVVVSGGEPTVHNDLTDFIIEVKKRGFDVKLDTNGSNPEIVSKLVEGGHIDFIGMDYKHLISKYPEATGVDMCSDGISPIEVSMMFVSQRKVPYDIRTTVHKDIHSEDDLIAMRAELDVFGIVDWVLQPFHDVDVIDNSLRQTATYSDEDLDRIADGLHDTEVRH